MRCTAGRITLIFSATGRVQTPSDASVEKIDEEIFQKPPFSLCTLPPPGFEKVGSEIHAVGRVILRVLQLCVVGDNVDRQFESVQLVYNSSRSITQLAEMSINPQINRTHS